MKIKPHNEHNLQTNRHKIISYYNALRRIIISYLKPYDCVQTNDYY